jgi:hypothetical protein
VLLRARVVCFPVFAPAGAASKATTNIAASAGRNLPLMASLLGKVLSCIPTPSERKTTPCGKIRP